MYIICSDIGQPLREELAKSPHKILANAFPQFIQHSDGTDIQSLTSSITDESLASDSSTDPSLSVSSDGYFHGLELISTLVKLMPDWLHANPTVFDTLLLVWKSPARLARLQNEQVLSLLQVCFLSFINYCCYTSAKFLVLFSVVAPNCLPILIFHIAELWYIFCAGGLVILLCSR